MPASTVDLGPAVERAAVVTQLHIATADDRCSWCWDELGVWTPYPCTTYRWAERVTTAQEVPA